MPTNLIRQRTKSAPESRQKREPAPARQVLIVAGRVTLRAQLLDTPTAARIWEALPIYSSAETWGQSVHFETPVETGRERTARATVTAGDIAFWGEDDRILIAYGPTPISKGTAIRLPRPCNIWAKAIDDVTLLKTVTPGEKVSVAAA